MKRVPVLMAIVFSFLGSCPTLLAQCNSLKAGETLWLRLLEPLSSYSAKTGDAVHAMVIQSPACDGVDIIAPGTIVGGAVTSVNKVGMGFVHETASMHVEFRSVKIKDSREVRFASRLLEIDNARESVKDGTIRGVKATDTPQGRITSRLKHLPT
jgi:hypothetical protein